MEFQISTTDEKKHPAPVFVCVKFIAADMPDASRWYGK